VTDAQMTFQEITGFGKNETQGDNKSGETTS
jgi:hypothetical protein